MFENITEVIGFDLGHGETALAHIYVNDSDKTSEPELLEIFGGAKNIITAIGYYPDHPEQKIWIGESALINPNIKESYITFKKKPSGDLKYLNIMSDYIKFIYENQIKQGRIKEKESFFVVGCPSEWTQDRAMVKAYEQLFSDAGIQRVKVVAESRAAYIHAVEKRMLNMAQLKGCAIVIDLGSSTTDITLLDQNKNSIPIDVGRELGAALIDKAIFQRAFENHRDKVELEDIFGSYPHFKNRCELVCRKVKEAYFSAPENYQESGQYAGGVFAKMQGIYFEPEVDGHVMNEILNTPIVDLGDGLQTWPNAFMNELVKLKQELEVRQQSEISNEFSGVILLTGGASRMDFVRKICEQVFPQASVESDKTPEFCIARGLARWGRVEINTSQFSKDVEKFCISNIRPEVAKQIDSLYDSISAVLADKIISIIKHNFELWKSRSHLTINNMKGAIDGEIKYSLQENNLSEIFGQEIKLILDRLSKELRNDIKALESQYSIPIGKLGESFDLKSIAIGSISLGNQSNIDATDDLMSGLSSILGWISGILATVVAVLVGPTVASITYAILVVILAILGNLVAGILLATPLGWVALAAIGITITVAGKSIKESKEAVENAVRDNLPSWDLPIWVRKQIKSNSVYSKIDEQRKVIIKDISSKLKGEEKTRQELIDKVTTIFESSLKAQAEDMKALIR
jgi:hypothetical protein